MLPAETPNAPTPKQRAEAAVIVRAAAERNKPAGWTRNVIDYDPFDGDFGDGSERTLTDEIRIAKRGGTCRECAQPVTKGMLVRVIKKADSEGFYGGRVCEPCCDAMATVSAAHCGEGDEGDEDEDGPDPYAAMDARHALRDATGGAK